ncbi:response regulator [Tunturibacter empetritectus]|uniref:DNA-binding response OmpR family regulator n=1 Tax=Tunturiibacter lichenicola TaxID=2051959 RepID=A0A7W8N6H3_9BACT|nr:response regulator [Edaphobacter lichenicola]MBB5345020.1 DNA-binding response OmpR family regulator [Edaphobacter lichenicola]
MRRRILLVDDEVAVLLTLKAVLEISGFDVDTAASAREGVSKLHTREYQMLITDMRMEHDVAGIEVIKAARSANYHPAVALLTAFPVAEEDWQEMGADQLLVKPMHTRILLQQIEDLIASHERKLAGLGLTPAASNPAAKATGKKKAVVKKSIVKKAAAKKAVAKKVAVRSSSATKTTTAKTSIRKKPVAKKAVVKKAIAKKATKASAKPKPARRRKNS